MPNQASPRAAAQELADFVTGASIEAMSSEALAQLKLHVLDSLGVAIGALDASLMRTVAEHTLALGGRGRATLIGSGVTTAPDRAAFHNGALVRYLDFMDSYIGAAETCHPSDNLAAVLAGAEHADADGATMLSALAAAYAVHVKLSDAAPVRDRGFDHTTQGVFAATAGAGRAMGLDADRIAHALAMAGAANVALRVTRTGMLSHWKGLAYPHVGLNAVHAALLAERGVTGPLAVFEGRKGWMASVAGPFDLTWRRDDLEAVRQTCIKKHNAEVHGQTAIEAALTLRRDHHIDAEQIERIEVSIFNAAKAIIGGGEGGPRRRVTTKEQADHSLPYLLAVAMLDGEVQPSQFAPDRIAADDVQQLLRRVDVEADPAMTGRFPEQLPCRVSVRLRGGATHTVNQAAYEGFRTRPMDWSSARTKFDRLAGGHADDRLRDAIADCIAGLESRPTRDLTALLGRVARTRNEPS